MIGLFVTPFWALTDLEFGETELRGGCGCACGGRFSEGVCSSTPITHVLLGQVATGVRDLLMGLGAPEGKGQGRLPGEEAGEFLPGLTAAYRGFLALLPSSLPFSCTKLTHPCPSRSHSLISKEITGEADLLV